jgi:hypothetical protein
VFALLINTVRMMTLTGVIIPAHWFFTTVLSLVFSAVFPLVIAAATSLRSPDLASLEIDAMSDWVSAQMNDRASVG